MKRTTTAHPSRAGTAMREATKVAAPEAPSVPMFDEAKVEE
jgi:hypothetical protein